MPEGTPVTFVTGARGAGKTTFLNQWLRQPAHAGALVVLNERGEAPLDHPLTRLAADNPFQPRTGCLCCGARDTFTALLREILPRARRGEIKRVVVEAAGEAEPAALRAALTHETVVASVYRLDQIITVVDGLAGAARLDDDPTALRQVTEADEIVISKADLTDVSALRARLRKLNPAACP